MTSEFEEIQKAIDEIRKVKGSIASSVKHSTGIKMVNSHDNYFRNIKMRGIDNPLDMQDSDRNTFVEFDARTSATERNSVVGSLERIEFMLEEMKAGKGKENPNKIREILGRLKDAGALSGAVYGVLNNFETIRKIVFGS